MKYVVRTYMVLNIHGDSHDGMFPIIVDAEDQQAAMEKVREECDCPDQCEPHLAEPWK
tara:strand:+ start:312 stop:485 length:174 start_codon:yes stop_codon:yes gene_type:complete